MTYKDSLIQWLNSFWFSQCTTKVNDPVTKFSLIQSMCILLCDPVTKFSEWSKQEWSAGTTASTL